MTEQQRLRAVSVQITVAAVWDSGGALEPADPLTVHLPPSALASFDLDKALDDFAAAQEPPLCSYCKEAGTERPQGHTETCVGHEPPPAKKRATKKPSD